MESRLAIQTLRTAFNKIKGVVSELGHSSVDHPMVDIVS
jgi:hypothetical protein